MHQISNLSIQHFCHRSEDHGVRTLRIRDPHKDSGCRRTYHYVLCRFANFSRASSYSRRLRIASLRREQSSQADFLGLSLGNEPQPTLSKSRRRRQSTARRMTTSSQPRLRTPLYDVEKIAQRTISLPRISPRRRSRPNLSARFRRPSLQPHWPHH